MTQERQNRLTVLAVDPAEAWWTLADVAYEGVPSERFTDLTCPSVVAGVWMAGTCRGKGGDQTLRSCDLNRPISFQ